MHAPFVIILMSELLKTPRNICQKSRESLTYDLKAILR